jgi:anti-sigma B factor antagonist
VFGDYRDPVLFATVTSRRGGWSVLAVTGDCDLASAPELRRQLLHVAGEGDRVAIDLSSVSFIDSVGLGLLIGAARRTVEVVVVAPVGSAARRALESSRVEQILDVRDALDP